MGFVFETSCFHQDPWWVLGSKFGRCVITSEGTRHVVLASVHGTRALVPGRGDPGHAGVHGPVCLQTGHSRSKIRNASSLSSHHIFQRLAPRLVAGVHVVTQPALTSIYLLPEDLEKVRASKVKRYPNLPLLAPPALVSRIAAAFNCPLHLATTASLRPTTPSGHRRVFRQSRGATAGSGLRLCVKDEVLQVCVLPSTQGAHSRIRWGLHLKITSTSSPRISDPTTRSFSVLHPRFIKR